MHFRLILGTDFNWLIQVSATKAGLHLSWLCPVSGPRIGSSLCSPELDKWQKTVNEYFTFLNTSVKY